MIRYTFKSDEPLTIKSARRASAQKIGEALRSITDQSGGKLTPKAVVDAASAKTSVLHRHFEWDDSKAAHQFRLDQARSLIRSIHVENPDTESGVVRGFLSIRDGGKTAYRTVEDVLTSADLQSRILSSAERDLLAFETRYQSLSEVCQLVRAARERLAARRGAGHDQRVAV